MCATKKNTVNAIVVGVPQENCHHVHVQLSPSPLFISLSLLHVCPVQEETLKGVCSERESTGVELYGIQQQLARQQMLMEKVYMHETSNTHSVMSPSALLLSPARSWTSTRQSSS